MRDLDLDGRPEVIALSSNASSLDVHVSSPSGIRLAFRLPLGRPMGNLLTADLVGDSRPEIAVLDAATSELRLFTLTPVGLSVAWSGQVAGASAIGALTSRGDGGVSRLVVVETRTGGSELSLLDAPGGARSPGVLVPFVPTRVKQADLDGDRVDEVIAFRGASSSTIGVLDVADGGLRTRAILSAGNASDVLPLDLDGDGDDDLTTGLPVDFCTWVSDDGGFRPPRTLYSSLTTDLAAADINGDGFDEVATVASNRLEVHARTDAGYWTIPLTRELPESGRVLGVGDLNLDGRDDLVVASSPGLELFADPSVTFQYRPNTLAYAFVTSDRQTILNVVSINASQRRLELLRGLPDGGLRVLSTLTSFFPSDPAFGVGDVNGDTHPDVFFRNDFDLGLSLSSSDGGLAAPVFSNHRAARLSRGTWNGRVPLTIQGDDVVVLALGDGGLSPERSYALPSYVESMEPADIDGDGRQDLVVTCGDGVTILRGLADGGAETYGSQIAGTGLSYGSRVVPADLDGDGVSELVVLNRQVELSIWKRVATQWVTVGRYPPGPAWPSLFVGDYDGDGLTEIAVTSWGTREITIISPNGTQTLYPAPDSYLNAVLSLDVDGDGRSELVTRGLWISSRCAAWR